MEIAFNPLLTVTDPHSFAQPQEAVVTHLNLSLAVDFATQRLTGTATYQIKQEKNAQKIVLDVNGLIIQEAYLDQNTPATFYVGGAKPHLGQPLIIDLLPNTQQIIIHYQT